MSTSETSGRGGTTSGFHLKIENLVQDENFAVASVDNYVLLVWRRRVTAAGAQAFMLQLGRLTAHYPKQKLGFLTLIEEPCSLSAPTDMRQIMAAALKTYSHKIGAAAIAYEMDGFWSAIVRSVITAINVASRVAFPSEVFSDAQESIVFVTKQLRDSSETRWQSLRAAMDAMRADQSPSARSGGA